MAYLETDFDNVEVALFEEANSLGTIGTDGAGGYVAGGIRSSAVTVRSPNVVGFITQESITAFALDVSGAIQAQGALGQAPNLRLPGVGISGTILYSGAIRHGAVGIPGVRVSAAILPEDQSIDVPGLKVSGTILAGSISASNAVRFALRGSGEIRAETADLESRDASLPGVRVSGAIIAGAAGTSTIAIALDVSGAIVAGGVLSGVILLPGLDAAAAGFEAGSVASGPIEIPLTVSGAIVAASITSASGNAFALNTKTGGLTRYTNFPFNSMVEFEGRTLAVGPAGIYEITGSTDAAVVDDVVTTAPIAASIKTGHLSLGSPQQKRIASVFVGYRSSGALRMYLRFDDNADTLYMLHETRAAGIYRNRVKTGRGAKGAYVQATIENDNGADFEIDTLEVEVETLRRRA